MTATTTYRAATAEDLDFYRTHGYIVVRDVIDSDELDALTALLRQDHRPEGDVGVRLGVGEGQVAATSASSRSSSRARRCSGPKP